jgi:alkylhydroperoxidase/carboxymuconolactone decarboxylase family protein YurZ
MELTAQQEALKQRFIEQRGYWADYYDGLLALDPDFFELFTEFSSHPWKHGVIEPKVKELIYIAIDAATTHLYEPGLRIHIRNALGYGATKEEILEVYELISVLGMHSITMGLPALLEEAGDSRDESDDAI